MSKLNSFKSTADIIKVINFVKENGFMTGSKKFGYKNNDIDYVIEAEKLEIFCNQFENVYKPTKYVGFDECEFIDLKLRKNEKDPFFDIIIVNEKEFKIWENATRMMFRLLMVDFEFFKLCKNKKYRVSIFQEFKAYYRS